MARTNPTPPLITIDTAELARSQRDLAKEIEALPPGQWSPFPSNQGSPLSVAGKLEAIQSHVAKMPGWKVDFKKGQQHHIEGHTFEVVGITRRGLVLRKK